MKKLLVIFIGITLGLNVSLYAKNYALITGVPSGFSNPGVAEGIRIDMALMKRLFESYGYEIKVLEDPTPSELRSALKNYQSLSSKDNFVFTYSGHGASVDDQNGDEKDGKDETLVLKDNKLFLDDELYLLFSKIKSQKYVFFDSCHSGTAFKSASNEGKYIRSLGYIPNYKGEAVEAVKEPEDGISSLFFFGAAQDHQYAMGTEKGGLFSNSIYDALKHKKADIDGDGSIKFSELERFTAQNIRKLCNNLHLTVYTPQMHTESTSKQKDVVKALKNILSGNSSKLESGLDQMVASGEADSLKVYTKSLYKEGDRITIDIDTGTTEGYLYMIYTDENDHTILYPNKYAKESQRVNGSFSFPASKFGRFTLSAQKPYGRTVVFTIVSDEPLDLFDKNTQGIFNVFGVDSQRSSKTLKIMRGIGVEKSSNISIGKTVFTVKP